MIISESVTAAWFYHLGIAICPVLETTTDYVYLLHYCVVRRQHRFPLSSSTLSLIFLLLEYSPRLPPPPSSPRPVRFGTFLLFVPPCLFPDVYSYIAKAWI